MECMGRPTSCPLPRSRPPAWQRYTLRTDQGQVHTDVDESVDRSMAFGSMLWVGVGEAKWEHQRPQQQDHGSAPNGATVRSLLLLLPRWSCSRLLLHAPNLLYSPLPTIALQKDPSSFHNSMKRSDAALSNAKSTAPQQDLCSSIDTSGIVIFFRCVQTLGESRSKRGLVLWIPCRHGELLASRNAVLSVTIAPPARGTFLQAHVQFLRLSCHKSRHWSLHHSILIHERVHELNGPFPSSKYEPLLAELSFRVCRAARASE